MDLCVYICYISRCIYNLDVDVYIYMCVYIIYVYIYIYIYIYIKAWSCSENSKNSAGSAVKARSSGQGSSGYYI